MEKKDKVKKYLNIYRTHNIIQVNYLPERVLKRMMKYGSEKKFLCAFADKDNIDNHYFFYDHDFIYIYMECVEDKRHYHSIMENRYYLVEDRR